MTRRSFLAATAIAAIPPPVSRAAARVSYHDSVRLRAQPFDLRRVKLRAGIFLDSAEINRRYMASLDPDRMLHMFRVTARLPSSAEPLGGWEQAENELRGHFTGHYLSACALRYAAFGDEALQQRANRMVEELGKCQKSHGNGYLSAFPEEFFDRLREGKRVWAPWYTLHKIMAGLLDLYTYCGNEQALEVLQGMAGWMRRWADPLGDAHMARILEVEYGGVNAVLYDLYAATGERGWRQLAHRFDHERIFAPLAEGRDELKGLHVNTQIPKIIGAARRYELTGEKRYRDMAEFFWRTVTERRCFSTGGTSSGERWRSDPGKLAGELGGYTQECCCTYNMLSLTRHLFAWSAEARCADYYERALFNGILGTQHPESGMTLYYVPLASGYWKLFGLPLDAFWCCTGTGIESFSKLADSIYFHDEAGVFVNLFIASELEWPEKGVRIIQETRFPEEESTALEIRCQQPVQMPLRVRVPYWATRGGAVKLNGRPLDSFAEPGGYFVLHRAWQDGDKVEITLPMSLHIQPMPDDESVESILYGPLVLAGRLGTEGLTREILRAEPTGLRQIPRYKSDPIPAPSFQVKSRDPNTWIRPSAGRLQFQTTGQSRDVTLTPLYKILDERYAVYWKVDRQGA